MKVSLFYTLFVSIAIVGDVHGRVYSRGASSDNTEEVEADEAFSNPRRLGWMMKNGGGRGRGQTFAAKPRGQQQQQQQQGGGGGRMMGNRGNMQVIQRLLTNHEKVEMTVVNQENGVYVKSTSKDPQVASWIKDHVQSMMDLVESGGNIRMWDPIFAKLLQHRYDFEFDLDVIPEGIEITKTATSPCVIDLLQWHADVVQLFAQRGHAEAKKTHAIPQSCK